MSTPTTISTGELTPGTSVIFSGHVFLNAVIIQPLGSVTIYDNTAASGKVVFQYANPGNNTESVVFRNAVRCDIGLTAEVATSNANVYWGAT